MKVFVAGTFWSGDVGLQLRRAVKLAGEVASAGHLPFLPQLYYFWHLMSPKRAPAWEDLGRRWLAECEAAIFVRGASANYRFSTYTECRRLDKPLYNSFHLFEQGKVYRWPGKPRAEQGKAD